MGIIISNSTGKKTIIMNSEDIIKFIEECSEKIINLLKEDKLYEVKS